MKTSMILPALALCALPAMAQSQSVSLLYSQLTSREITSGGSVFTADKSKGFALRYGHDIMTFSPLGDARLVFEGTWMPKTGGQDLKLNGAIYSFGGGTTAQFRHEYMGLGLALAWTKVVDFGAALELRHEGNSIRMEGGGEVQEFGNDVTRPWLSLRGGYTFQTGKVKPFVSLEYNLPLAKKETALISEISLPQNLNPKSQLSLNAGVRF